MACDISGLAVLFVTLERARAWVESERFAEAAALLVDELPCIDESQDVGLRVRARSLYGDALAGSGEAARAERELQSASRLWGSELALDWIRGLPTGETSQRDVRRAAAAAARASLHVADLRLRALELAPPVFVRVAGSAERQRRAFGRYLTVEFAPWAHRQYAAYEIAQRHFEQVYLSPPVAAPEWRVAVAARIGSLWGRLSDQMARVDQLCGPACDDRGASYHGTFDDPWEPERQRARAAFETCITLSRKYRLLTDDTLTCERWLGSHFRTQYSALDELVPTAHWGVDAASGYALAALPANRR
ncbi:MAG TPA: hypothetical protein VFQ35_10125 [Polyangiaceae bacterium]|nr:hypothetical protein [Polyangiaceae bacterium]